MRSGPTATPSATDAVIVFTRPSSHGSLIESPVFRLNGNTEEFLGFVPADGKLGVRVTPGRHCFMTADQYLGLTDDGFINAEVEAGKTYYVLVSPRGWPRIRFALIPVKRDATVSRYSHSSPEFGAWEGTTFISKAPAAEEWAQTNATKIRALRERFHTGCANQARGTLPQFVLQPADGI